MYPVNGCSLQIQIDMDLSMLDQKLQQQQGKFTFLSDFDFPEMQES